MKIAGEMLGALVSANRDLKFNVFDENGDTALTYTAKKWIDGTHDECNSLKIVYDCFSSYFTTSLALAQQKRLAYPIVVSFPLNFVE